MKLKRVFITGGGCWKCEKPAGGFQMPNEDRTGPDGKGPKTGMQRGKCEGAQPKQGKMGRNAQENRGRGFGRNCPRGRRFRNWK